MICQLNFITNKNVLNSVICFCPFVLMKVSIKTCIGWSKSRVINGYYSLITRSKSTWMDPHVDLILYGIWKRIHLIYGLALGSKSKSSIKPINNIDKKTHFPLNFLIARFLYLIVFYYEFSLTFNIRMSLCHNYSCLSTFIMLIDCMFVYVMHLLCYLH